jgi:DNA-binding NarL/FixJ family response regulator
VGGDATAVADALGGGPTRTGSTVRRTEIALMSDDRVSVLVVDDDEAFLLSARAAIDPHPRLRLAALCTTLAEARAALAAEVPQVLMVDLGLPDGNGIELIREVAQAHPDTDVLVVTVFGDEAHVLASIEAGATGYLLKRSQPEALAETVLQLRDGGSPISPIIARQLLKRFKPPAPVAPASDEAGLSEREREVLVYIAKGFTVAEIATMLTLSAHTVGTHVKRIYRKLSVHSRAEALYEASRMGLL